MATAPLVAGLTLGIWADSGIHQLILTLVQRLRLGYSSFQLMHMSRNDKNELTMAARGKKKYIHIYSQLRIRGEFGHVCKKHM